MNTTSTHRNGTQAPQSPAHPTASARPAVRDCLAERVALLAAHGMPDEVTICSVQLMRENGLLGYLGAAYYRTVCTGLSTGEASMMYAEYRAAQDQRVKRRKEVLDLLGVGRNKLTYWVDEIPTGQPFKDRQHAEQIVFGDQWDTIVTVRIAENLEECHPFTVTPGITEHKAHQIHPLTDDSESCSTAQEVSKKVRAIMGEALKSQP